MPSKEQSRVYGSTWQNELFVDVQVPSGAWCQIRKVNARILASLGLIDTVDPLSALVEEKHIKRVKGGSPTIDFDAIQKDPKAIVRLIDIAEKVAEAIVVQPDLKRPIRIVDGQEFDLKPHERVPGQIYTDMVDDLDLMHIFNEAIGGMADLEQFRDGPGKSNGSVQSKPKSSHPAKRPVRHSK